MECDNHRFLMYISRHFLADGGSMRMRMRIITAQRSRSFGPVLRYEESQARFFLMIVSTPVA